MARGWKHTEEDRKRMSLLMSGKNNPMYGKPSPMLGKHLTDEQKKKISIANSGKNNGMYGKSNRKGAKHTEESKRKMSESCLKNPSRYWLGKKKVMNQEWIRNALKPKGISSLEKKMLGIIETHNLPYKFVGDGNFFIEKKCPDFVNTNGKKIAIEVFYRKHKELFRGDIENWKRERQEIFSKYGWEIKYFDETQVNEELILKTLKGDD